MLLNLGSGQRKFGYPWVNADITIRPPDQVPDVCCDGRALPFPDLSAEYVVLHHVLEHFGCGEADGVVRECFRVLKPGGSLLVFVPDLRQLAKRWLVGQLDHQLYVTQIYGAYQGQPGDRHAWGYDANSLWLYLDAIVPKAYTTTILQFDWRPIPGASIAKDWYICGCEVIK